MFRKYNKNINQLGNQLLCTNNNIAVITPSQDSKSFIVKGSISMNDLIHTTEIYTPYGRVKIIIDNEQLFLITQTCRVPLKYLKEMRFYEPIYKCISNEIASDDNVAKVYKTISKLKSDFFERNISKLNNEIRHLIDATYYSLNITHAYLTYNTSNERLKFTLTPETILSFETLKKQVSTIDNIISNTPLTAYVQKK